MFNNTLAQTLIKDTNKSHTDPSNYRPIFCQSVILKCVDGVADMDVVTNAQSYGVEAERVTLKNDLVGAMQRMISAKGPYVVECVVPHEDCYPWIKPGTGFPDIITASTWTGEIVP